MTEHEIAQNLLYMRELSNSDMLDFITVLFAYVVVAHFAGAALSRVVATTLSALYSGYSVISLLSLVSLFSSQQKLGKRLYELHPAASGWLPRYEDQFLIGGITAIGLLSLGWLFSLCYMHFLIRGKSDVAV